MGDDALMYVIAISATVLAHEWGDDDLAVHS